MPVESRIPLTNFEKEIASFGIDFPDPEEIKGFFEHDSDDMCDSSVDNDKIDAEVKRRNLFDLNELDDSDSDYELFKQVNFDDNSESGINQELSTPMPQPHSNDDVKPIITEMSNLNMSPSMSLKTDISMNGLTSSVQEKSSASADRSIDQLDPKDDSDESDDCSRLKIDTCLRMPKKEPALTIEEHFGLNKFTGIVYPEPLNRLYEDYDDEDVSEDDNDINESLYSAPSTGHSIEQRNLKEDRTQSDDDMEEDTISTWPLKPVVNSFYDQSESDSDDREPFKGFVNDDDVEDFSCLSDGDADINNKDMSGLSDEDADVNSKAMSDDEDDMDYYLALLPKNKRTSPININDCRCTFDH